MWSTLQSVTDPFGRVLTFSYNKLDGTIASVTDPAQNSITYTYMQGELASVTYGGSTRSYHYDDARFPHVLTSIVDENNSTFATWAYDANGRASSSQHASGAELITIAYPTDSSTSVTTYVNPSSTATSTYTFQVSWGVRRLASITGDVCPNCGPAAQTFDPNGNVATRTDWNGNQTTYSYDTARNLENSRTEAYGTPQARTITSDWHPTFRLPARVAEPLRITTTTYDTDGTSCGARGAMCSKTIQATSDSNGSFGFSANSVGSPRTWTYTYNANGSVLTIDGPRTDVSDITTYTYYANDDADLGKRGNVATITNAAGHVTSITAYNAHGQPLTIVDPNAMTTTLTYDDRQRLKSRNAGSELTSYDYDNVGQLTKVTLPDGSYLSYTYDAAHRLTDISDNLGNRISYTLDAMGNRTQEQVFDPASQLVQTRSRVYNNLNRLFQELGAQNQTTEYGYDDQGNVTSVKDPLNHTTVNQYDALNRVTQVTDPGLGVTQYAYNGLDALIQVTDPRNLVTGYVTDGLRNLIQRTSPDTGATQNTYDAAGNLLTQLDAKNQVTTYAYDALNRVTLVTFQDGSKQTYGYDQGANGIGRLSTITETNSSNQVTSVIAYAYDQHGRVTNETRTVGGVQYAVGYHYDSGGHLDQLTYPSGRTVAYTFDSLGRISSMTTAKPGEPALSVVSNVAYHPFGGVKSYTLGNGEQYTRSIDLDGRIASYTLGAQSFAIGYDAASRIAFISENGNPSNSNTYGYDALDRLTSAATQTTGYGYAYDAVGNRSSRIVGANTDTYAYSSTSNRIASITPQSGPVRNFTFDSNGSTSADGVNTYGYDTRGRMVSATSSIGTTTYQVNALGQRVRKTNNQTDRFFHYYLRGHLIAETDPGGGLLREIIYLGDIPVGVVQLRSSRPARRFSSASPRAPLRKCR
jgi:YD repeat-containing protein